MEIPVQDINLQRIDSQKIEIKKSLGLSNSPNVTVRAYTKKYYNGEGSIRISYKGSSSCKINPPLQQGQRICLRLSGRAKRKIKLACRMFQEYAKLNNKVCCLITLTYGNDFPNDIISKKHLDNFLKRLTRLKGVAYFLWVAEKQKRGAIHYHILSDFTSKEFINKSWNQIVQKWQVRNGFQIQTLLPNVKSINYPANYLSKYLTKGDMKILGNMYGMSTALRELTKPILEISNEISNEYLLPILEEALSKFPNCFKLNQGGHPRVIWDKADIEKITQKLIQINQNIEYA